MSTIKAIMNATGCLALALAAADYALVIPDYSLCAPPQVPASAGRQDASLPASPRVSADGSGCASGACPVPSAPSQRIRFFRFRR